MTIQFRAPIRLFAIATIMLIAPFITEPTFAKESPQPLMESIVAVVDDGIILKSELDARVKHFYKLNKNRKQPVPPLETVRTQVLEQMIVEEAQLQLANRSGVKVNDDMINMAIGRLAKQNKMSQDQFRAQLIQEFGTYTHARASIRNQLIMSQLRDRQIARSIEVSEEEVDFFLEQTRNTSAQKEYLLRHILISLPSQPTEKDTAEASKTVDNVMTLVDSGANFAKVAMTYSKGPTALEGGLIKWRKESELPTLLSQRIDSLQKNKVVPPIRTPGGYHIFKVVDIRGGHSRIITKYDVRHVLIKPSIVRDDEAAQTLAQELREKVTKDPKQFTQIANTYSDDPGSAREGGLMKDVESKQMVGPFKLMMENSAIGTISPVFKTDYGWHFLQVMDKREEDVGTQLRREEAKRALFRRKFDEKLVPWIRKIRQEAYVEVKL